MQQKVSKYECDNCRRVTYTSKSAAPAGWKRLRFGDEGDDLDDQDICFSCTEAIVHALGRRKSIERGSPTQETKAAELDGGQVDRQTALLLASRAPGVSAD